MSNSVYVEGLPPVHTTELEVLEMFSRCGMVKKDKIKLYRSKDTDQVKGDCLITFVSPESVFLAIQQFDGAEFKPGFVLKVSEAEFTPTTTSQTTTTSTTRDNKDVRIKKVRRMHERAKLSWDEDVGNRSESALLIVVLKGMFIPGAGSELDEQELERDLIEGLEPVLNQGGGEIKKITLFKSHPEAVILIRFNESSTALACVELMDGRWFDGRKVSAELWDGVTEYAAKLEPRARALEDEERLARFERTLEEEEDET
ncbi:hypothetical protein BASA81_005493 [Batrachochytrium salamandrivorans]|nr:hypothetical protein BASA81_005493 [Batrachochytrium salamandrivorans]